MKEGPPWLLTYLSQVGPNQATLGFKSKFVKVLKVQSYQLYLIRQIIR